jgi:hypothetical protein
MRRLVAIALLGFLAGGCARAPEARPHFAVSPRAMRIVGHRRVQPMQPQVVTSLVAGQPESEPIPCYTLDEKHRAFGGVTSYVPTTEVTPMADERGGMLRHYSLAEPIAGTCGAPQTLKMLRLDAAIAWSPATCAHLVRGAFLSSWEQRGGPRGVLGYPITDELPTARGGGHQYFEHGEITWTPLDGVVVRTTTPSAPPPSAPPP